MHRALVLLLLVVNLCAQSSDRATVGGTVLPQTGSAALSGHEVRALREIGVAEHLIVGRIKQSGLRESHGLLEALASAGAGTELLDLVERHSPRRSDLLALAREFKEAAVGPFAALVPAAWTQTTHGTGPAICEVFSSPNGHERIILMSAPAGLFLESAAAEVGRVVCDALVDRVAALAPVKGTVRDVQILEGRSWASLRTRQVITDAPVRELHILSTLSGAQVIVLFGETTGEAAALDRTMSVMGGTLQQR